MEFSTISSCFRKVKSLSNNLILLILAVVQRLRENGKGSLCASNRTKSLSVHLQTTWLWNRFLLQLLKLQHRVFFEQEAS